MPELSTSLNVLGHCPRCGNRWRLVTLHRQHWAYWRAGDTGDVPEFEISGSEPFCVQCGAVLSLDDIGAVTSGGELIVIPHPEFFSPTAN